jgi:hypothetical protein
MNKRTTRIKNAVLLFGALFVEWFICIPRAISYPPGPDYWYRYPGQLGALALVLPVAALVGRSWYWLPAFFGFGAFAVFPVGAFILSFDTEYSGSSTGALLFAALPILLACCVAGCLAAWVGSVASRRLSVSAAEPNHALQRTETGGGASADLHA